MWVGAQAWGRARARGDRRRLPTLFRRETQPTAKPQPVLVVENVFLADLEFRRFPWDLTRKRDETRDEKTEEPTNDVKAAAAKTVSGEGVEPTYTMTDMIEFATRWQEERDTTHAPIQIKGRAAKIKFHD